MPIPTDTPATLYRKKPVVVEAMRFTDAQSAVDIIDWSYVVEDKEGDEYWLSAITYHCNTEDGTCSGTPEGHVLKIRTLEGDMIAAPGDYVIRGVQGEFYPCKPDIFEATYDAVVFV